MQLIIKAVYVFLMFLEVALFFYIVISWIPISLKLREISKKIIDPILDPIRFILKKSIFKTRVIDLAPIIAFLIISYLQQFTLSLK